MSDKQHSRRRWSAGQVSGSAGFITVILGYLYSTLAARDLTLWPFVLNTLLSILYCLLFWWLITGPALPFWRRNLVALLGFLLTSALGYLPLLGLEWNWLIYLVTASLYLHLFSLTPALILIALLYLANSGNILVVNGGDFIRAYPAMLQLLAAYAFVFAFNLGYRLLEEQQERAEEFSRQLESSKTELERAHKRLQEYATQLEELTVVRERTRLAREIHDTLGHHLSLLNIQLETISRLQKRDPARLPEEIVEARRVAAQSMQEVRNAVAALRPSSIANLSLRQALTQLAREFEQVASTTTLTLDLETELPQLTPEIQLTFYRAAQEALTNVRKHARASKVLLRLRFENAILELLILDNGEGASQTSPSSPGFGLVGLRERIELLGGQITAEPVQPSGFRVTVQVPLPQH